VQEVGFIIKNNKINQMMSRWVGHVALSKAQMDVVRKLKGKRNLVRTRCRYKT
jgi:hypothetical protein